MALSALVEKALHAEFEAQDRARARSRESLRAFIRRASPHLEVPEHLSAYLEQLEAALTSRVRITLSAPPQHGKTELTMHGLAWLMSRNPKKRNAYVTYAQSRADRVSINFQRICDRAGMKITGNNLRRANIDGGQMLFVGLDGQLTGEPIDGLLVVDDPIKGREDAESSVMREKAWDAFQDVCLSRLHPGASAIAMMTRWHPDDLVGRLIGDGYRWQYLNLPAISDDGQALWPSQRPIQYLEERRTEVGEYSWSSMYMGAPRNRGTSVLKDKHVYEVLPTDGYRVSIGADFAYTAKTYSDFNAAVVLYHKNGISYVAEVVRERCDIAQFKPIVQALHAKHGGRVTAFVASTEMGVIEFLKSDRNGTSGRLDVDGIRAATDKFTRAQPVAAAWNAGKVLMPKNAAACANAAERKAMNGHGVRPAEWEAMFLNEAMSFTGVKDKHDDMVDALAGAFHPFTIKAQPRSFLSLPNL